MHLAANANPKTVQHLFVALFVLLLAVLSMLTGALLVNWHSVISLAQSIVLQTINIGVAYGLAEFILASLVIGEDVAHLASPRQCPAVAVLYTTCDDLVPEALGSLRNLDYPNYCVYILDDSTKQSFRAQIDASGFKVVRRATREGFKAGNLNNWLSLYGDEYDYFVVADSDSILPPGFVTKMLTYAQHPANRNVAVFQSEIMVWNTENRFARTVAGWTALWLYPVERLCNLCETMLSWGHNCLYRTSTLREIGGFDTRFVAEDYATGVTLLKRGYTTRLVDIITHEALPDTISSYTSRAVRWAQQTIQLFGLPMDDVPLTTRLHIMMNAWSFFVWMLYIPGVLLALWGSHSTLADVGRLLAILANGNLKSPIWPPLLLVTGYNIYFLFLRYPLALRLGIGGRRYFVTLFALLALAPYMVFPLAIGQFKAMVSMRNVTFVVTRKGREAGSAGSWIWEMRGVFLLLAVTVVGMIHNPLSAVFNAAWLVPMLGSPMVLWWLRR